MKKFGWNGKATCPTTAEPGPYGLGPFVLKSGYFEGDRFSDTAVLEANPHYFEPQFPKVEKVTLYLTVDSAKTKNDMMVKEGVMDIMPIPFSSKVETMMSKYNVMRKTPSTNNYAVQINMINGNPKLMDKNVRVALNRALDQKALISYTMEGEGVKNPNFASHLFPGVGKKIKGMPTWGETGDLADPKVREEITKILNGLEINVYTLDSMLFLWKGIQFQLSKFGVKMKVETTVNITDILNQMLSTRDKKNSKKWDLIGWELDDWYGKHPWSAFLLYRTSSPWSTIADDAKLNGYIDDVFRNGVGTPGFDKAVGDVIQHAHDNAYMLFLPTPNKVLSINAEVIYEPWQTVAMPLWDISVTKNHWSLKKP